MTYTIAPDHKSILCHKCGRASSNPNDVRNLYCGYCHVFHNREAQIAWDAYLYWVRSNLTAEDTVRKCGMPDPDDAKHREAQIAWDAYWNGWNDAAEARFGKGWWRYLFDRSRQDGGPNRPPTEKIKVG